MSYSYSSIINSPRDPTMWNKPINQVSLTTSICQDHAVMSENQLIEAIDGDDLNFSQLSEIYQFNFQDLKFGEDPREFFHVRELVYAIEAHMREEGIGSELIRQKMKKGLKISCYQMKMAELGLIFFYLDRSRVLPEEGSLLSYRAKEMQLEVEECLKAHKASSDNPLIPSGKTHSLMHAFAHMVMTKTQVFNRGGIIALKILLESASFPISFYLQPEHRSHILVVINQILLQPRFDALFQKKIKIHSSLQDVIRLDLKLSPGMRIHAVHIFWDLLMMFFSDIRQTDANCYAVSALIYGIENYLLKVATRTLELLNLGFLEIGVGKAVPLAPLLEKRLKREEDLDLVPEKGKGNTLCPVLRISSALNLEPRLAEREGAQNIRQTLSSILQEADKGAHLDFAEKFYCSYKYNVLEQMMLLVSELTYINQDATLSNASQSESSNKSELIDLLLSSLEMNEKGIQEPIPPFFKTIFRRSLEQRLWLENCNELKVSRNGSVLTVGERSIKTFKGNLDVLTSVLENPLQIFYLHRNECQPLHSISDLQRVIVKEIASSGLEYAKGMKTNLLERRLRLAAKSKKFRIAVSNYCSNKIKRKGITGKQLNWADLLLLDQEGGHENDVLKMVFNVNVLSKEIERCNTPYQFLQELQKMLKTFDRENFKSAPKLLIAGGEHAWTLATECWDILLENSATFYSFIQTKVFNPAKRRMSSWIPRNTIERVIDRYTKESIQQRQLKKYFNEMKSLTFNKFRVEICGKSEAKDVLRLEKILEEEFAKIKLSRRHFTKILSELNLKVSNEIFHRIWNRLPDEPSYPFFLADLIRKELLNEALEIVESYEIEHEICKILGLPLSLKLGDTNWVDSCIEDPYHVQIEIGFNYMRNTLQYRHRHVDWFEFLKNSEFKTFKLYHPRLPVQGEVKC